ncbi:MAG: response regulator [Acidobacteriota bacterium]
MRRARWRQALGWLWAATVIAFVLAFVFDVALVHAIAVCLLLGLGWAIREATESVATNAAASTPPEPTDRAHEIDRRGESLRTHLLRVRGYADLVLLEGRLTGRSRAYAEKIHGLAERASGLTNELCAVAHGEEPSFFDEPSRIAESGSMRTLRAVDARVTVLVAEDEEEVARVVREILERSDYRVLHAADGEAALELFETQAVDLALLDVVMPRLGGLEVYERIRALEPGLPIVFMSGYSDGMMPSGFLDTEGVQLLAKPFSPDELTKALGDAMRWPRRL